MGSTYEDIEVDQEGPEIVIAFNNRFLIDSVRSCDADKLKISLSSALTSINIEPYDAQDDKEEVFMILPVRMKE
jgi:DNA polymerase-3 subunit beta